jgi:O-antigen/teichoic acid export membrane protein
MGRPGFIIPSAGPAARFSLRPGRRLLVVAEQPPSARDGLYSVTHGTVLMLLGTLVYVGATFLIRVLLVRTLPPPEWTDYAFAAALTGLLAAIGTLGLPQAVARSLPYARSDEERRTIVRSSSVLLVTAAIGFGVGLAATGAILAAFYDAPTLGLTLEAFSVALASAILASWMVSIFQGYEDVRPNVLYVQVLNPAAFFVLLFLLFRLEPSGDLLTEALGAYVAANVATVVGLAFYLRRRLPTRLPPGPQAPAAARRLYLFAAPLLVVAVAGYVTGNADLLLLGVFHYSSVGGYSATLTLARLLTIGIGSLAYIFLPVATRFVRAQDAEGVRLTYTTATKWVALTSLPLFLLFFFYPGASLAFVYGSLNDATTLPLRILVTGAVISTLVGPAAATQVSFGQTRLLVYNAAISAFADVSLAAVLTPAYGATGAAIAWATANSLLPILSAAELAVLTGVHPFRRHYVVPVLLTGIPVGLLFAFAPFHPSGLLLPAVGLGVAALYVLIVLGTGSVDHGDGLALEVIERMLGRRFNRLRRLGRWRARR